MATENKTTATDFNTGKSAGTGSSGASVKTAKQENNLTAENQADKTASTTAGAAAAGGVKETVKNLYEKAKDSSAGQTAGEVYGQAKDKAANVLDEKKSDLASGLTSVADSLRQTSDNLQTGGEKNQVANLTAKYGTSLADQVEKLSGYLDNKDLRGMLRDLETFARRNPAVFLGGAFALGFLAARFLKSSNPNQALMRRPENGGDSFSRESNTVKKFPTGNEESNRKTVGGLGGTTGTNPNVRSS